MQEPVQHVSPIKNWKQLVTVVVFAFVVPIALGVLLSQWVTSGTKGLHDDQSLVLARIRPVGQVLIAAPSTAAPAATAATAPAAAAMPAASAPAAKADGKKIFDSTCLVCHGAGVAGAPKFGDKAAWAPRLKKGVDALYKVALGGNGGAMPPRGGNNALSDAEVKAAVDYMVAAAK
jgi:cytochrome c5